MEKFYIYILYSAKLDKYYVGSTSDIDRRIAEHNRGKSTYTKPGLPWELVYTEEFPTKREAVYREMEIKKRKSRTYIEKIIA